MTFKKIGCDTNDVAFIAIARMDLDRQIWGVWGMNGLTLENMFCTIPWIVIGFEGCIIKSIADSSNVAGVHG